MARRALTSQFSLSRAPLVLGVANLSLVGALQGLTSVPMAGAAIAAGTFWAVLALVPQTYNRAVLFSPRNWTLFMIAMSMLVGPAVFPFSDVRTRLWILTLAAWDTSKLWDYTLWGGVLWAVGFAAYAAGLYERPTTKQDRLKAQAARVRAPAADWMLAIGVLLVVLGVVGILVAFGGIGALLRTGGSRSVAEETLVAGTYRFVIWMEGVPIGAALLWYYWRDRLRLGRFSSALLLLVLYLPLFPFYLYSSGRARALIPLVLLGAFYHRYSHRFRAAWLLVGIAVALPVMAAWANFRVSGELVAAGTDEAIEVLSGDFSRFDVSVAAMAGFHEGRMDLLYGETILVALSRWLPFKFQLDELTGGTMALVRALYGSAELNIASPYATALPIEGYLNFGWLGVIVLMALAGRAVRWLDRLAYSGDPLMYLAAMVLTFRVPMGVALEIVTGQLVWAAGVPLAAAWAARQLVGMSQSKFRKAGRRRAAGARAPSLGRRRARRNHRTPHDAR